jgi:hypothetical protein
MAHLRRKWRFWRRRVGASRACHIVFIELDRMTRPSKPTWTLLYERGLGVQRIVEAALLAHISHIGLAPRAPIDYLYACPKGA